MFLPPRIGSGHIHTGFNKQSLSPPSACNVLDPSKPHVGSSETEETVPSRTFVFDLKPAVGSYPSIQIYSAFTFIFTPFLKIRIYNNHKIYL